MAFEFKKAQRTAVKLKMLITGASGSGKTLGALYLADGLAPGKVAVVDSENDRSSYYADQVNFDVLSLPNAEPKTYIAALDAAIKAGYEIVILDSLSHSWQDVLNRKSEYDARKQDKSNPYVSWGIFGAEWDRFIRAILEAPVHVIATARSKQDYEQIEENGKKKVVKLGLAPQIREGTDYEFALHFDLNESHSATVRKDNTFLFNDQSKVWDLTSGNVLKPLLSWLSTAKPVAKPTAETVAAIDAAITALPEEKQAKVRKRWAERRVKGVTEAEAQEILGSLQPEAPTSEQLSAFAKVLASDVWTDAEREAYRNGAQGNMTQPGMAALLAEIVAEGTKRAEIDKQFQSAKRDNIAAIKKDMDEARAD